MSGPTWSLKEEKILKDNYGKISVRSIMSLLPNRTENNIRYKVRLLNLFIKPIPNVYIKKKDYYIIVATNRKLEKYSCIIDKESYNKIKEHQWYASKESRGIYFARSVKKEEDFNTKSIKLHTFLKGQPPEGLIIDHHDRNTLNNRLSNLKFVTHQQNAQNSKSRINNTSGYTGVSFTKNIGKYEAYIFFNYKKKNIGYYAIALEAAKAYNDKATYYNENHNCKFSLNEIPETN